MKSDEFIKLMNDLRAAEMDSLLKSRLVGIFSAVELLLDNQNAIIRYLLASTSSPTAREIMSRLKDSNEQASLALQRGMSGNINELGSKNDGA